MRWMLIGTLALIASCGADDTEDTQAPEDPLVMDSGMLAGCSGQIAWEKWERANTESEVTLLFVNGRTEYTDKYHHIIPMLGDRPWDVIMWDHYGQGRSDGVRAHADDFETQHVCDMGAVIDELADEGQPIVLIAHSMGGMIATRYVQLNPGVITAAVFSSPLYGTPTGDYTEAEQRQLAAGYCDAGLSQNTIPGSTERPPCEDNDVTHDCELYDQFKDDPLTTIGPATYGWLNAMYNVLDGIRADTDAVTIPVLVNTAGEELVVEPAWHATWCDGVNADGGDCSHHTYPGDYHELFNELDREDVMANALTFLEGHLE